MVFLYEFLCLFCAHLFFGWFLVQPKDLWLAQKWLKFVQKEIRMEKWWKCEKHQNIMTNKFMRNVQMHTNTVRNACVMITQSANYIYVHVTQLLGKFGIIFETI